MPSPCVSPQMGLHLQRRAALRHSHSLAGALGTLLHSTPRLEQVGEQPSLEPNPNLQEAPCPSAVRICPEQPGW